MNIIDLVDPESPVRYNAGSGQTFRIPRLSGKTQIIAGITSAESMAHWDLYEETVTVPSNPDDVLQPPQKVGGAWVTVWEPRIYTMDEKRGQIRECRDQAVYAGITVNGVPIDTNETTQGRLAGAALQAIIDPNYTVNWKAGGQFITLDASQILDIAQAVRAHVQACFDREAELLSLTDPETGKPREPSAEEINSGWPA